MMQQLDLFSGMDDTPGKVSAGPRVVYFDLETQKSAQDVGGWGNSHLMKLAVGVVWDSLDEQFHSYLEKDAAALVAKLRSADLVVGFNVISFDYAVLQPYASVDLLEINTFDMLVDVQKNLGYRLKLDHLAQCTLKAEKSADGLVSLQWFKEGKIDLIVEYCKKDVEITRDLFLFGEKNGHVLYRTKDQIPQQLAVRWNVGELTRPKPGGKR
jgi:DEAD/DEAH box helicase domain-containing protein